MHRRFVFLRDEDETGISGTGLVVMGVMYPDGVCHYRWITEWRTDQQAPTLEHLYRLHGHQGRTRIVFLDDEEGVPHLDLLQELRELAQATPVAKQPNLYRQLYDPDAAQAAGTRLPWRAV